MSLCLSLQPMTSALFLLSQGSVFWVPNWNFFALTVHGLQTVKEAL
jgi:hypothetical protein